MRKPSIRTEKDYEIIRTYYADTPMAQLLEILPHRNKRWIHDAAQVLGVKRDKEFLLALKRRRRTPKQKPTVVQVSQVSREDEIIQANYPATPMAKLLEMLPDKDAGWIQRRAQKLGVKRDKEFLRQEAIERAARNRKDVWTPEEEAELARKWPILGGETSIAARTASAIQARASAIKARVNRQIRRIKKHSIWIFNAPANHPDNSMGDRD